MSPWMAAQRTPAAWQRIGRGKWVTELGVKPGAGRHRGCAGARGAAPPALACIAPFSSSTRAFWLANTSTSPCVRDRVKRGNQGAAGVRGPPGQERREGGGEGAARAAAAAAGPRCRGHGSSSGASLRPCLASSTKPGRRPSSQASLPGSDGRMCASYGAEGGRGGRAGGGEGHWRPVAGVGGGGQRRAARARHGQPPSSRQRQSLAWRMSSLAPPTAPTVTRTGAVSASAASRSTWEGGGGRGRGLITITSHPAERGSPARPTDLPSRIPPTTSPIRAWCAPPRTHTH